MNKKLICTAVGATLVATAGVAQAVKKEQALDALIPYVVKDTSRTTVVTVILDGANVGSSGTELHLQYQTKSTTAANTAGCTPNSITIPVTKNDMLTFDTAGLAGYPLFGDTTNPSAYGASISYAAPRHGYLWLEGMQGGSAITAATSGIINAAYWLELDLANGGAHGDQGFLSTTAGNAATGWGADHVLQTGAANAPAVAFWPTSVAAQVFTVTPLGSDMLNTPDNVAVLQVVDYVDIQGVYDRNEKHLDGTVPQTVKCVGRLTPADLMPGVLPNAGWAAQGGFGYLTNLGDNTSSTTADLDAVVYQVDTATQSGKFVDNATRITTNMNASH